MQRIRLQCVLLAAALVVTACVQPQAAANAPATSTEPHVFFVEPLDQTEVESPVTVRFGADHFTVEPAGSEVKPDHGHLHVMVDTDCVAAGQPIPSDETHLHYGKAQIEATLELPAGEHTLCLQAADSNHMALAGEGMTHVIRVKVK